MFATTHEDDRKSGANWEVINALNLAQARRENNAMRVILLTQAGLICLLMFTALYLGISLYDVKHPATSPRHSQPAARPAKPANIAQKTRA